LFGVSDHLKRLLAFGDLLEAWGRIAEFRDILPGADCSAGFYQSAMSRAYRALV
jgi:hypothetical protein